MATRTDGTQRARPRRAKTTRPKGPRSRERHWLYQEAVQSPEVHFSFFERVYKQRNGVLPDILKEDFCGTALMACEWVERYLENEAIGVDLDEPTLQWGRDNNIAKLEADEQRRITLIRDDVLNVTRPKADIVAALNFSYNIFQTRKALKNYFKSARKSLTKGGVFIGDIFGGWEAQKPMTERTRYAGFTYVWDQKQYDPINNHGLFQIHFEFHNGGGIRRAFEYDWRLWTIPEIHELLQEAGFDWIEFYWEDIDRRTGMGNSRFRRVTKTKNSEGWIAYFVASNRRKKRA
jgi:SAM-dependent methyltransferase